MKGKVWTYTGMPLLNSEWVYPRLMSISTVFSPKARNIACPFCVEEKETEIHFLLEWPVYVLLRHKYLPDKASALDNRSHFLSLMNSKYQQTVFSVAKCLVCAFILRTSKMEVPS